MKCREIICENNRKATVETFYSHNNRITTKAPKLLTIEIIQLNIGLKVTTIVVKTVCQDRPSFIVDIKNGGYVIIPPLNFQLQCQARQSVQHKTFSYHRQKFL